MAREVVISAGLNESSVYVWEPGSLTILSTFTENCGSAGLLYTTGHVLSAQGNKNLIHYYKFGRDTPERKSTTIDRVTVLASSGCLISAGSEEGNITIWDIATGQQILTWNAHFRAVNALVLTEQLLVSGGDDGAVLAWTLSQILTGNTEPIYSANPHTMSVKGLKVYGHWVLTCSADHTYKLMAGGQVLKTFTFPSPLNAVEFSLNRATVYLAGADGNIHGCIDDNKFLWEVSEQPLTALAITNNEKFLFAADQQVYKLDALTGAKLNELKVHTCPVVSLQVVERPEYFMNLQGPASAIKPLKRVKDSEITTVEFRTEEPLPIEDKPEEETGEDKLRQLNSAIYKIWVEHWV